METLTLTKNDLKILLASAALIPLLSFAAGFFIGKTNIASPRIASLTPPVENIISTSEAEPALKNADASTPMETEVVETELISQSNPAPIQPIVDQPESKREPVPVEAKEDLQKPIVLQTKPKEAQSIYIVQAGSFSQIANAKHFLNQLEQKDVDGKILNAKIEQKHYYRVIVGTFENKKLAQQFVEKLNQTHQLNVFVARSPSMEALDYLATAY